MKKFRKEESGGLVEFVILLAVVGIGAALLSPLAKLYLTNIYYEQSTGMTFSGHKLDSALEATKKDNNHLGADNVDLDRKTR